MSDLIKHECGIAFIRLLKPLEFYIEKYKTPMYGLGKLNLLMEKQRNRGQDGAGIGSIKLNLEPGRQYMDRRRSTESNAISLLFDDVKKGFEKAKLANPGRYHEVDYLKKDVPFAGELLLGHLRYATHSKSGSEFCHPRIRTNNWKSRNLMVAGNFNMTNNDELFQKLIEIGQHPKDKTDTITVLEKIGHFLDEENQELFRQFKNSHTNQEISELIANELDVLKVLRRSARDFDGGFTIAGLIGHGDAFVLRDPAGIRPAFYYQDEEVLVVASERPAIQTAFATKWHQIHELEPGHAIVVKQNGTVLNEEVITPVERLSCSFERIYFSRGTDRDIYQERKKLGHLITADVLKAVNFDLEHTVFSYIPNTAETAFLGLNEGINDYLNNHKKQQILNSHLSDNELSAILSVKPRTEKIVVKDEKLRTFITADGNRNDMVGHGYDTTYGLVSRGTDTLVVIDDSIVRGTTLKKSILSMLQRLGPKKIVVVSSAPQIRYPDCYGIDMSKLKDFVAFRAAIELLKDNYQTSIIEEVYAKCVAQELLPKEQITNYVKEIYAPFTDQQISDKIAEIIKPETMDAEVKVLFQTIENLHIACPNHLGDWYFTGNFPTPGGNKVVNRAFINFYRDIDERAY